MPQARGNSWAVRVRFPEPHGYIRKSFKTLAQAEAYEKLLLEARDAGKAPPSPAGSREDVSKRFLGPFIDTVFPRLWGGKKSERHMRNLLRQVVEFYGSDAELEKVFTTFEYDRYMDYRREDLRNGNKTLNRHTSALSVLAKEALRNDLISSLPKFRKHKEGRGRVAFMTPDMFERVVNWLWTHGYETSSKFVEFLVMTGARPGKEEAGRIAWHDWNGDYITIDGKTGPRTLKLPQRAKRALQWSKDQGHARPFEIAYETFHEHWTEMRYALGRGEDPYFVPYICRHTCASWMASNGIDLRRIKDWMGHSDITTTMRYAHLIPGDIDTCADTLDAVE